MDDRSFRVREACQHDSRSIAMHWKCPALMAYGAATLWVRVNPSRPYA